MATLTEAGYAGEFIRSEANGTRSRDVVTLISGQNLKAGAVLGKITASGKYTIMDKVTPASDGSQNAAAILYDDCDASGGDKSCVAILRSAEVSKNGLVWRASTSGGNKTTAYADLAALGIIARD